MQVKKPGKMRWDYKEPEHKLFVSDGRRIYLHVPADNQVIISPVPDEDQATTAVLFLVGKGNLTRDFTVSYARRAAAPTPMRCGSSPGSPSATTTGCRSSSTARTLQIRSLSGGGQPGRPFDVPVHQLQGKRRTDR